MVSPYGPHNAPPPDPHTVAVFPTPSAPLLPAFRFPHAKSSPESSRSPASGVAQRKAVVMSNDQGVSCPAVALVLQRGRGVAAPRGDADVARRKSASPTSSARAGRCGGGAPLLSPGRRLPGINRSHSFARACCCDAGAVAGGSTAAEGKNRQKMVRQDGKIRTRPHATQAGVRLPWVATSSSTTSS